jgi:H+-transporting ATPase
MSFLHQRKNHRDADDVEAARTRSARSRSRATSRRSDWADMPEFEALDRFVTTYDAERRLGAGGQGDDDKERRKWWQFWKSAPVETQEEPEKSEKGKAPQAWLDTDLRTGLTTQIIEERRKQFGWNELSSEKENLIAKFIGYFKGPILYGMSPPPWTRAHTSLPRCEHVEADPSPAAP